MFCPECAKDLEVGVKKCPYCGESFDKIEDVSLGKFYPLYANPNRELGQEYVSEYLVKKTYIEKTVTKDFFDDLTCDIEETEKKRKCKYTYMDVWETVYMPNFEELCFSGGEILYVPLYNEDDSNCIHKENGNKYIETKINVRENQWYEVEYSFYATGRFECYEKSKGEISQGSYYFIDKFICAKADSRIYCFLTEGNRIVSREIYIHEREYRNLRDKIFDSLR